MSEIEFIRHLESEAERAGMTEPKRSRWVRYSADCDSRRLLLRRTLAHLDGFDAGSSSFLDVGAGYGNLVVAAVECFQSAAGIEIEEDRVEWSKLRAPSADLRAGSADDLPWPDAAFDFVACLDVYEHLTPKQQAKAAQEAFRVLRPGGYLLVAVPNRFQLKDEHHFVWLGTWPRGALKKWYVEKFSGNPLVPCWEKTRVGWRSLFAHAGFQLVARPKLDDYNSRLKERMDQAFPQRSNLLLRKP